MVRTLTLSVCFIVLFCGESIAVNKTFAQDESSVNAMIFSGNSPLVKQTWQDAANASSVNSASDPDLRKKQGRAFTHSLLLPGWGQFDAGKKTKGYVFFAAEVLLWGSLIGHNIYSNWLEEDYKGFASQHASVRGDHPHQFYVDIGNWLDERSYNEQRIRDRDFESLYTAPEDRWRWDSDQNRAAFKSQRIASDKAGRMIIFMAGGIVLNHLASAIDAAKSFKGNSHLSLSMNDKQQISLQLRL